MLLPLTCPQTPPAGDPAHNSGICPDRELSHTSQSQVLVLKHRLSGCPSLRFCFVRSKMRPRDMYFFAPGVASPLIEVGESLLTAHGIRVTQLEYKHLGINYNICTYLYYMMT